MNRKILSLLLVVAALAGCASSNQLASDVNSYSRWPAERKPATYTFERLPSQESRAQTQQMIEAAARPAIEAAGFVAASDPGSAEYLVQLAARVDVSDVYVGDPYWGGSFYGGWAPYGYGGPYGRYYGRYGWPGPYYYGGWAAMPYYYYQREVAVLIRDRRSGTPLYETRASTEGGSPAIETLLPAMFEAAMKDFPNGGVNPRRVTTLINKDVPVKQQ